MSEIAHSSGMLVKQYQDLNSGHFFDPSTMKFFSSRVLSDYKRLSNTAALFITTDKPPHGVRVASVRLARLIDNRIVINTLEPSFVPIKQAKAMIKSLGLEEVLIAIG
jgi:hypothetical protein